MNIKWANPYKVLKYAQQVISMKHMLAFLLKLLDHTLRNTDSILSVSFRTCDID